MGTALLPGRWMLLCSPSLLPLGIVGVLLNWNMGNKLSWISRLQFKYRQNVLTATLYRSMSCNNHCLFNSSIWNTNRWRAACGCRNSLSCCLSDTINSYLGFGSGKNTIYTIQFSSLVDCQVTLLPFARTSSELLPVGMQRGCAFLTSSTHDLMAKLVMPAVYISFS